MQPFKKILFSTAAAAVAFTGWQVGKFINNQRREHLPYSIILNEGKFEIRFYPPHIVASVVVHGSYDEVIRTGIKKLKKYVNGGNDLKQDLNFLKPFTLVYDESSQIGTVTLSMPKSYSMDKLPKPDNDGIQLKAVEGEYKANLCFSGASEQECFNALSKRLVDTLELRGFKYEDKIEHLFYNDLMQVFGRRNEVQMTIENFE